MRSSTLIVPLALLTFATPALAQKPSTLRFTELKRDFGSIVEGENLVHEFAFEVAGEKPLKITNVHASCGCTIGKILIGGEAYTFNTPIDPGSKGSLKVTLRTQGYRGVKSSTVDLYSDGAQGKVQLSVSANIQQFFQVSPPYVNFGMVGGGSRPTQEITVWSTQVPKFEITEWGEAGVPTVLPKAKDPKEKPDPEELDKIKAEDSLKIQEKPEGVEVQTETIAPNRYKLTFQLTKTDAEGVFAKRLRFLTDQGRAFDFTVHAVVQPLVGLDPPTHLAFGVIRTGTSSTQQFRLVDSDETREVKITGFKVENCAQVEHLTVTTYSEAVPENPNKKEWYLRITVNETMPAGAFRGQVKIETDHPEFPERVGYFTGYVR